MDFIQIEELKIFAHHGVYEAEEKNGQEFEVSGKFFLSLQESGLGDELEKSISYEELCIFITKEFTKQRRQLIEAVAEDLSCALFSAYPKLCALELTVAKPSAPIAAEFRNVSVTVFRKRHSVFLGYGANVGDPPTQIAKALKLLGEDPRISLKKHTEPIVSSPYGGVEQPDFYNGVIELTTIYEPLPLLQALHRIEEACGLDRARKEHWGPREMDLDILFYDDLVLREKELVIPHPDLIRRDFVLLPLKELAPELLHPVYKKTVAELADGLSEHHICP